MGTTGKSELKSLYETGKPRDQIQRIFTDRTVFPGIHCLPYQIPYKGSAGKGYDLRV
jgi:hypothetical protein